MAAQLAFASDYMEGAHPAILKKLAETNLIKSAGYGLDEYSETQGKRFGKPQCTGGRGAFSGGRNTDQCHGN